jgi:hypothetical protein
MGCRCVSGCAQDLLVFPSLRESNLGDFAVWLAFSPVLEMAFFHPFLFLFLLFFSGYQRACLFFSCYLQCEDELSILSVWITALVFEAMLDFLCYASMLHFAVL